MDIEDTREIENVEESLEALQKCLEIFGIAYTYDNDGENVLLDPSKLTIHQTMYAITYGDGYAIEHKGKKLIFTGYDSTVGALSLLSHIQPDIRYKIERYNPNKKLIRV